MSCFPSPTILSGINPNESSFILRSSLLPADSPSSRSCYKAESLQFINEDNTDANGEALDLITQLPSQGVIVDPGSDDR